MNTRSSKQASKSSVVLVFRGGAEPYSTVWDVAGNGGPAQRQTVSQSRQQAHRVYLKEGAVVSRGLGHGKIDRSTKATGPGVICCGIAEVLAQVTLVEC